jgi:hypothetical protein
MYQIQIQTDYTGRVDLPILIETRVKLDTIT